MNTKQELKLLHESVWKRIQNIPFGLSVWKHSMRHVKLVVKDLPEPIYLAMDVHENAPTFFIFCGDEQFARFFRMQHCANESVVEDYYLQSLDALQFSLEKRNDESPVQARLHELKSEIFRGEVIPVWTKWRAGRMPVPAEVTDLLLADDVFGLLERIWPTILENDAEMIRYDVSADQAEAERLDLERFFAPVPLLLDDERRAVLSELGKSSARIEADLSYPGAVQDEKTGETVYPLIFTLVDRDSEELIVYQPFRPETVPENYILQRFYDFLKQNGRPEYVAVRNPELYRLLSVLCHAGNVDRRAVSNLPATEICLKRLFAQE